MTKNQIVLARIALGFCVLALFIVIFPLGWSKIAICVGSVIAGIAAFAIVVAPDGVGGRVDKLVIMIFLVFCALGFLSLLILCLMPYQDHEVTIRKFP